MPKKIVKRNWRVVVEVSSGFDAQDTPQNAQRIANEIRRHVDHDGVIRTEYDALEVCEDCDREWETDSDGCPECCAIAQVKWAQSLPYVQKYAGKELALELYRAGFRAENIKFVVDTIESIKED